ncbi:uncharacterized protein G2W53_026291 [Senna tora]|uniref:Uncharacterized protein n=1 Tax=Senna tora TaxID=362788 RepID=A0A834WIP5_9FABA|nr:uncharacterized protein G2W53_026291 [Senna tora]
MDCHRCRDTELSHQDMPKEYSNIPTKITRINKKFESKSRH